ncbi:MAG: Ig-like domain-containing protein [Verrucomicrobiota bacterium]
MFTRISSFAVGSVTLAWDASSDVSVTGYRLYYGVATGSYTNSAAVGNVTSATLANLSDGVTYYFAVTAYDSQGTESLFSNEASYAVPAAITNAPPTLDAISAVAIAEDASVQTVSLSGISSGSASETQTLVVTASSSNPGLIPNPTVSYASPSATGSLNFTPVANATGTATITVTVDDGQAANNTTTRTFVVTVNAVNDTPTLNALSNVSINEDASVQTVSLSGIGTGAANETQTLTVTAASSNPALIPNPTVSYTSPNATGSLSFSPVANASGSATITVTVNDGQAANNTVTRTFTVTVNAVNDAPTLNTLANVSTAENAGQQTVGLTGVGTGAANESDTLTVTAASSNPSVIPNPTVNYTSPSATGSLTFTPVADASGTATITVTVNDGQAANNTVTRTFTVTVAPVNNPPTLNALTDVTINEDAGAQSVSLAGIGTGAANETQTLTVTAVSSDPSLIPNPSVSYTSPSATGSLNFTPVVNANGTATITVTVNDGQTTNNTVSRSFVVTVNAVNDVPTLAALSNLSVAGNAGNQNVSLSGIGTGATNETQALAVIATSSNPSLIPNPTVSYTSPSATGSLSFAPAANIDGTATITVTVNDGQAANNTVTRTFTVTVSQANAQPTLAALSNVTLNEDAGAQTVGLSGIGSGSVNESQTLTVTATSSNPGLIPNPTVSYTSPSATGSLSFTPVADANGTATISVTVNDGGGISNTMTRTFTVTVSPVNDAPLLNGLSDVTVNEDASAQTVSLSGISTGSTNETQTLTITAVSSNPSLIPNPTVSYTSPSATGSLSFTPVANANGSATITVTVNDGQAANNTVVRTFTVTVSPVNDAPTVNTIANVSIGENSGQQSVGLSGIGAGAANETQTLTVTAVSSNPSLIPNPTVSYVSPSATGNLTFTPAANQSGSATITVTVDDGQAANNTMVRTFTVAVNLANVPPTLTAIGNVSINEDATAQTVALSGISSGSVNESQTLTVTATSSNPSLIPNPTVSYASPDATGSLSFAPLANGNGTATISVTVNDGHAVSNTLTRTFTVTVNAVNDMPTLNALSDMTVNEDAGAQTVSLSGISTGATNETQTLTVTAVSSNPSLIPNPTVSYGSPSATGSLSFTPVANANGSATITVTVNDGQAVNNTVTRTFNVTVSPVNDAPTVNTIANVSIGENSGQQTVSLNGIGTGAANETQTLTVTAVSSNPSLIPNPTVSYLSPSATGSLVFTPAANQSGSATITVTVDDGQAANNTVTRTFTVAVNLANVPPTLTAVGNVSINEDATAQTVALSGISSGSVNESQTLTITAVSSNPSLIPNPTVSYISPDTTGSLSFTPAADANGTATISVTVNDGHAVSNTLTRTFTVTVNAVNDAPTLGAIADAAVNEDSGAQSVSLAGIATGAANETQTLTVTAVSSNPSLIPNPSVSYTSPNAGGTLTFTPVTNGFGSAVITVTVNDGQAANNTAIRTFNVTVSPVNDTPTLNAIANVSIGENAPQQTVSLMGIGSGAANETQTLTVTAVSSDPSVIPNPTVSYTSPGATGSLAFTPVANTSGSATVTVTVNDGQAANNTVVRTFTVAVNVANVPPTLAAINNVSLSEEAAAQTVALSGISSGSVNENQTLTVTASSSNPSLIPNPTVTYTSPNTTGSLGFTPVADANGSAIITVTVNDGHAVSNTFSRTFTVTVAPVNDTPTLNAISNVTVDEDASAQTVGLSGISTGSTNETQTLTITAVSSNPSLIPNPTVSYASPSATGNLSFTPVANANGSATITVTVNDGQAANNTLVRTFTVTVNPVNDTPTLGTIANRTIAENAGLQTVSLSGIGTGAANETQALGITATSSDPSLIPNPTVSYASPNTTGSLSFTPVTDANGTVTITVTVNDGQAVNSTTTRSFAVTVTAVNSAPTITAIPAQTIVSGGSSAPLSFVINDVETTADALTLTALSSAPSIVPLTNIVFSGTGSNRSVTVTSAGVVGAADITINVTDGAASASTTFPVTVTAAPPAVGQLSMTKSGSGTVTPDLGATTLIVGQTYSVTATPAAGYLFGGWSGSVSSTAATITFTMRSNTVLQASFVANPYTTTTATYNGLFNEADEVRLHSSGAFNLFMDGNGNFSAWVQIGYSRYQFAGVFGLNLRATNVVSRWDGTPLTVELLVGSGATSGQISGRVTDGVWSAPLSGGRQVGTTTLAGEYTVVIPGTSGNAAQPAGDGYATMHVADDGLATMSATLADGSKYSHSAYLTTDGDWPMYVSLYVGKGSVMSWLTFTNLSSSDVSGNLVWTKLAGASPISYPLGFTNGTKAVGSTYVMPLDLGKALNLSGAVVSFTGGNLTTPFNNVVSVNSGSQVVNLSPNTMNFKITKSSGLFTGDVQDPISGQTYTFGGVVLQKQNAGYGTMPGATLASRVVLAAP